MAVFSADQIYHYVSVLSGMCAIGGSARRSGEPAIVVTGSRNSCAGAAYPSQREDASGRAAVCAERIRAKPGWSPGILNGCYERPKGMHRRTFQRLCGEHECWEAMSLGFTVDKHGISMPSSWDALAL